ncbi:Aste57867_10588 [Aphanomyces stellatus]|uniref:very-long-chain (3R)-3-hydroxyacyl-CoA dehydratase n=1 Tax=Aphanomyces stellatus TaxID=120398 RepID=A0A485KQV2_9STRA|nr:hypothetical protein As57867_010548 [Aphanomyces stellatus]VFT87460.1 Aste57867_10588 [Aphanomyces stellatus]
MMIKTGYLVAFNVASCIGWTYILMETCRTLYKEENVTLASAKLWAHVEISLKIVQTLAILEVLHAMVGLVRSPVTSTAMQVSSRLFNVWVILVLCPDARYHWGFIMTMLTWSVTEVPRYAFYALSLLDAVPDWLFFLRYHTYIVLYPSGLIGEMSCILKALPFLSTGVYSIQLPNEHNLALSLYVVVLIILATMVAGMPVMYSHMNTQRKKAYAKKNEVATHQHQG